MACPAASSALAHRPSSESRKMGVMISGRESREGRVQERRRSRHGSVSFMPSRPLARRLGAGSSRLSRPSLLLITAIIAGAACRPAPAVHPSISLVDDAGDTVRLAAPARRVVSLIPASTELLFGIGADSAVVGRTSYCDYPPEAKAVPDLGDGIKPNIEAVIASRPDLVVLYNSGQNAAVAGRLRELGIAALRVNTDALSSVPRVARILGKLTGREKAADSLAAVFDTALASATQS